MSARRIKDFKFEKQLIEPAAKAALVGEPFDMPLSPKYEIAMERIEVLCHVQAFYSYLNLMCQSMFTQQRDSALSPRLPHSFKRIMTF